MSVTVFSSTGCIRCGIVKNYLHSRNIPFEEHDIKTAEGNDVFKAFYREHREEIRRDGSGIFFPIVADGAHVVQDAGATLAWFICRDQLDAAITPNNLGHGWIGGLNVSACAPGNFPFFLEIIRLLKAGGLAISLCTDGRNAGLLEKILTEKLADKLEFSLAESRTKDEELAASLAVAQKLAGSADLVFFLDIQGPGGLITPAGAATIAKFAAEATGDNRLPLRICNSSSEQNVNLLPYRTETRRWQMLAELA